MNLLHCYRNRHCCLSFHFSPLFRRANPFLTRMVEAVKLAEVVRIVSGRRGSKNPWGAPRLWCAHAKNGMRITWSGKKRADGFYPGLMSLLARETTWLDTWGHSRFNKKITSIITKLSQNKPDMKKIKKYDN